MKTYRVIGLMSGTSLDGLDIAYCTFSKGNTWAYRIIKATTVHYTEEWKRRLTDAMNISAEKLAKLNVDFGRFVGENVLKFMESVDHKPDFISSHGHTIFHQPQFGFTLQIGDGNAIAAKTGLPVVFDFRSLDVALGGQGAPLVPIGDQLLFDSYSYCLNLGGIANISYEVKDKRIAFDVCPANMLLNHLSGKLGMPFDQGGDMASRGKVLESLLTKLNALNYYLEKGCKTLGREWFGKEMAPFFERSDVEPKDLLRTAVEHIACQVGRSLPLYAEGKMLVTGGGAFNDFLITRIREFVEVDVVVPDPVVVNFKEALIFAFLGVLRYRNQVNCLASVTGASRDSCTGIVADPFALPVKGYQNE